jgi:hypothetical protein
MSHTALRRQVGVVHREQLTLFTSPEAPGNLASPVAAAVRATNQSGAPASPGGRS